MSTVSLAVHAMATRFELVLHGTEAHRLRAAGEEALAEVQRLEAQLSLFRPGSQIAQVNARAARESVEVTPEVFALLQQARALTQQTDGAFDITIAPLMRCWGFREGGGRVPTEEELAEARGRVGMHLVQLEESDCTVRFARDGVQLDLGAIGKGYAVDCAVDLLREAGITSALFHGGTSTAYGLGSPPNAPAWTIAIDDPRSHQVGPGADHDAGTPFASISLRDEALSVSAVWGRSFAVAGKSYGHIIDPRTGRPAASAVLAAVALPSATETDALSTALLTMGLDGNNTIKQMRPAIRSLVTAETATGTLTRSVGIQCRAPTVQI